MSNRLVLILLAFPLLICGLCYVGEWAYTDIRYQRWLSENKLRVDFSAFQSREEVRKALLKKLPVATPKEDLMAFRCENGMQHGVWLKTTDSERGYTIAECLEFCKSCNRMIRVNVGKTNRGHFLRRLLAGDWIIFLELDPDTHTLIDIQVKGYRGHIP